jgi:hypothetical protein
VDILLEITIYLLFNIGCSEDLKQAPQKLATYVEGKHYLHASKLLATSVTNLFGEDLLDVGALVDLRKDLLERKNVSRSCN